MAKSIRRPAHAVRAVAAAIGLSTLLMTIAPVEAFFYRRGPLNPLPPHAIEEIVRLDYGFRTIRSLDRQGLYYVVDGVDRRGFGTRVVLHAYHGYLIDSIALRPPAQVPNQVPQRLARAEPGQERGTARVVPVPPSRPITRQAAPESLPPAAKPPVAKPPVAATAPATAVPRAVPRPSLIPDTGNAPSGAATRDTPASRAAPRLVNPQDVRPSDEVERTPPMARGSAAAAAPTRAAPRVIAPGVFSPSTVPPATLDDTTTRPAAPATPPVPVTPLN